MTDAEYMFMKIAADRKRVARGDYNKKRQGGRTVRFPSDNLTKKERDKLSGEVVSYQLGKPTDWATLKSWPEDIQKAYLSGLRKTYGVGAKEIGEMLGVSKVTVCHHEKKLGISAPIGKASNVNEDEWSRFLGRSVEPTADPGGAASESSEPVAPAVPDPLAESKNDLAQLFELLSHLKGSGAKITIEITL